MYQLPPQLWELQETQIPTFLREFTDRSHPIPHLRHRHWNSCTPIIYPFLSGFDLKKLRAKKEKCKREKIEKEGHATAFIFISFTFLEVLFLSFLFISSCISFLFPSFFSSYFIFYVVLFFVFPLEPYVVKQISYVRFFQTPNWFTISLILIINIFRTKEIGVDTFQALWEGWRAGSSAVGGGKTWWTDCGLKLSRVQSHPTLFERCSWKRPWV